MKEQPSSKTFVEWGDQGQLRFARKLVANGKAHGKEMFPLNSDFLLWLLDRVLALEPKAINTVGQLGEAIEPALRALVIEGNEPHQLTVVFKHNEDGSVGLINAQYIPVSKLERAALGKREST